MYIFIAINLPIFLQFQPQKPIRPIHKLNMAYLGAASIIAPKEAALGFHFSPCLKICCLAITLAYALFGDKE